MRTKIINQFKAYFRLFKNRFNKVHPLEQNFVNTKPKLHTINPTRIWSYNDIILNLKQNTNELSRSKNHSQSKMELEG